MRVRRILAILVLLFHAAASSPALGAEPDPIRGAEAEPPPTELLEFLGEWESGDGEWLDPTLLEDWLAAEEPEKKEEDDEAH